MIRSFRSRALKAYWTRQDASKIPPTLIARINRRLLALNDARAPDDLNVPGFDLHGLHGKPKRHSIHVNGPWCITFEWAEDDAESVDLENYH